MKEIDKNVIALLEKEKKVTLGFSAGKDSLTCAVLLKKMNIEYIPFYFYHVPELEFVEKTLRMYENILEVEVIRMPHPMLYDCLRHQDFVEPRMIYYLNDYGVAHMTFKDLINVYLEYISDPNNYYDITGQRASESFNRRMYFKKYGFINEEKKQVNLIADWTNTDIINFLENEKIPLSEDYKIWNRSFDGLKYQFLFGVKEHYPNDWNRIKQYFPLIDIELFRYEHNKKYYD